LSRDAFLAVVSAGVENAPFWWALRCGDEEGALNAPLTNGEGACDGAVPEANALWPEILWLADGCTEVPNGFPAWALVVLGNTDGWLTSLLGVDAWALVCAKKLNGDELLAIWLLAGICDCGKAALFNAVPDFTRRPPNWENAG